ncbi:hypothetical protein [Corynebacterium sp.]|uniref:hypothetical protein n=1 Tax=Corynebacterium sp. TaxID=1720 RepID=UPI002A910D12|nr:hypothetical protein [Corynebacterium sp.]MDY5786200.1 hypothetical protein [Corynebacterium sp.]
MYFVALIVDSPTQRVSVLAAGTAFLAPVGAACVAWTGVSRTMHSNRQQDLLKEWHSELRWATEMRASGDPAKVPIGVAILDALDDLPFLGKTENHLIDAVIQEVTQNYDQ